MVRRGAWLKLCPTLVEESVHLEMISGLFIQFAVINTHWIAKSSENPPYNTNNLEPQPDCV